MGWSPLAFPRVVITSVTMWLERGQSALGVAVILLLAWLLAPVNRRRSVVLRPVVSAFGLLVVIAVLLLRTPLRGLFSWANDFVEALLGFTAQGSRFVFGDLVARTDQFGFIFAFQVLPTIIFVSALMSLLYHVRIMPWIVQGCGKWLSRGLGVSGAESLSTVADVFIGQAEAPLVVKPYVPAMTVSELNACMVAGYTTTAGGVLAAYVAMLSNQVPGIAGHLMTASVLGAPASLVIAKLMLPETELPVTSGGVTEPLPRTSANAIDAVTKGTVDGLGLALNIGAMLIVFLALTAMVDGALTTVTGKFGTPITLNDLFRVAFYPLAWLMGTAPDEVGKVAALLGKKTVLNEFIAYSELAANLRADPAWLSERGRLITSYALCGFANFGSIGIQVAAYTTVAPDRSPDITRLALRAMLGGLLATCLTACVIGILA